jgi:cell division protein YceG involved in septum cleavage
MSPGVALCAVALLGIAPGAVAVGQLQNRAIEFSIDAGERVADLWRRLEASGLTSEASLLEVAGAATFDAHPFVPAPSASISRFEGLFAPGTYSLQLSIQGGLPAEQQQYQATLQLIAALLEASHERLARLALGGSPPLGGGLATLYRSVTLASIVEKEDVPGREYGTVASVFENRLRTGMRLGSCPTLEYALGYHRPFLLDSDIAVDSPYNTYLHGGLPPTPICFFSDAALQATLHPPVTSFYFFVLDWVANRIYFAHTYQEHLANAHRAMSNFVRVFGAGALHMKEPGKFYTR